jgi:hypothetical protein
MSKTCRTHGRNEICVGKPPGKSYLGNQGVDGRIILRRILKNGLRRCELGQVSVKWWVVVNTT